MFLFVVKFRASQPVLNSIAVIVNLVFLETKIQPYSLQSHSNANQSISYKNSINHPQVSIIHPLDSHC